MPDSESLFYMHALLEYDYAILTHILYFFGFLPWPKVGTWHNTPTLNTSLDVHVLMVTA